MKTKQSGNTFVGIIIVVFLFLFFPTKPFLLPPLREEGKNRSRKEFTE